MFTTLNSADTRDFVIRLMYEGKEVNEWRLLEEHAPPMPSLGKMNKHQAEDPVAVARYFDLKMKLFFKHIVGVDLDKVSTHVDGSATEYGRGLFGVVRALHSPIETQCRGGLHGHTLLWVLHPMLSDFLDQLGRRHLDESMKTRLTNWRRAVIEKVGGTQFESVEEVGRQLGLSKGALPPLPMTVRDRTSTFMDGALEEDDLVELPIPESADNADALRYERTLGALNEAYEIEREIERMGLEDPRSGEIKVHPWGGRAGLGPMRGPKNRRQFVPVDQGPEFDPFECANNDPKNKERGNSRFRYPLTGAATFCSQGFGVLDTA